MSGDRVSGFPSLRRLDPALSGENVAPTPAPYHSYSSRVSNSVSSKRRALQVHVGCSQLSSLQENAQQDRTDSLEPGKTGRESLLLGMSPTVPPEWGELHSF